MRFTEYELPAPPAVVAPKDVNVLSAERDEITEYETVLDGAPNPLTDDMYKSLGTCSENAFYILANLGAKLRKIINICKFFSKKITPPPKKVTR